MVVDVRLTGVTKEMDSNFDTSMSLSLNLKNFSRRNTFLETQRTRQTVSCRSRSRSNLAMEADPCVKVQKMTWHNLPHRPNRIGFAQRGYSLYTSGSGASPPAARTSPALAPRDGSVSQASNQHEPTRVHRTRWDAVMAGETKPCPAEVASLSAAGPVRGARPPRCS